MATGDAPLRARSLRLLSANPPFRLLWSARAVSFLGDSLGLVALMLHVADTTGRALAVALLLLVGDFAPALLGPLAGTLADRLDRKRVMVSCELVQGVLVGATALWLPPLPVLLVLVGLRALAGQVFQPASRATVPALVPDRDLGRANAAIGIATNGLGIAGMDVAANTVLQRIVPSALLGRVFGSLYGAIGVAAALAYLLGGLLLDRTTPRITFVIAGAGGLLATLATAAALRHAIREPHPEPLPPDSNEEPAG